MRAVTGAMPVSTIRADPSTVTEGNGADGPTTHSEARPERSTSRALARPRSVEM